MRSGTENKHAILLDWNLKKMQDYVNNILSKADGKYDKWQTMIGFFTYYVSVTRRFWYV